MTKVKPFSNDMQSPQDPSAFLKAVLKIPDVNPQTSKQESKQSTPQPAGTLQKATVLQKAETLNPPPLVQQLFDHARRTEQKKEKVNPVWYSSQLLRHFSYNGAGIPKYNYIVDEKTGLISAHVMLENAKVFKGDPCTTHEQAAESAAKKAYKALNFNKASMHDTKIVMTPQWFNTQQNNWIQNIRPPMMPPMGPLKMPPVPQTLPMQPNLFYPKWNPKMPPNPAFGQVASYSQVMQQQVRHQGQQKGPQNGPKMEIRNSTAFVPLQAQKKSRNASLQQASKEPNPNTKKSSSPKAQQQQQQKQPQKQEETLPKKQKSEVVNKAREKTSSEPQKQQSQQPQQNAGKSSKPRKSRVAAKFGAPPLSNGGEPPQ